MRRLILASVLLASFSVVALPGVTQAAPCASPSSPCSPQTRPSEMTHPLSSGPRRLATRRLL